MRICKLMPGLKGLLLYQYAFPRDLSPKYLEIKDFELISPAFYILEIYSRPFIKTMLNNVTLCVCIMFLQGNHDQHDDNVSYGTPPSKQTGKKYQLSLQQHKGTNGKKIRYNVRGSTVILR